MSLGGTMSSAEAGETARAPHGIPVEWKECWCTGGDELACGGMKVDRVHVAVVPIQSADARVNRPATAA